MPPNVSQTPKPTFWEKVRAFKTRVKANCANTKELIHQKFQHSTVVVAFKTLLGKNTVLSEGNPQKSLENDRATKSVESLSSIKRQIQNDLAFKISATIAVVGENNGGIFSIGNCTLDELKELVMVTRLQMGKGGDDDRNGVNQVKGYVSKFIDGLRGEIQNGRYSPSLLQEVFQEDFEKIAIIKKICPQEVKKFMKDLPQLMNQGYSTETTHYEPTPMPIERDELPPGQLF